MAAVLSACGTAGGNVLPVGPGSLRIQAGDDEIPGLQKIADRFTEATGVSVEFIQREINAQSLSDFIAQAPMGQAPDILISPHDNLGQLAANGVIASVEMGDRGEEFTDNALTAVTYDGISYGVPYAVECVAMVRNDDLTREEPATFDELREVGHGLMDQDGLRYPFTISQSPTNGDPYHLYALQTSFGAEVFARDQDGEYLPELTMGGPEGLEFADYLAELGETGDLRTSMTPDIAKEAFLNGDSAFHLCGPWDLVDLEAAGMNCTVLPVPPAGTQQARPFAGVQAFFVNANGRNPVAAQDFVTNWITQPESQLDLYESTGRPPASSSAVDQMQDDPWRAKYAEIAETALPMPAIPAMGAVWSFWGTAENAIVDGRGDPQQLWENMIVNIEGQI
ncbi:sugar ABC transporter substrate-binding protein [Kocuria sp.]|uniref:sugar ABC transporter substrate-binding protein n=1 Tax=Kocuria sp. TaxID=1871328 RepID=UPI0026E09DE8|nr:maltose ABC transporter substrate-binding protein [Kocuria sp.]MDO5619551.1 maltose ABC transporter substrate-binding protein [Kocuria sp.]